MNREQKKIFNKINALKAEIEDLLAEDNIEEAESKYAEIEKLQKKFDMYEKLGGDPQGELQDHDDDHEDEPIAYTKAEVVKAFVHTFCSRLSKGKLGKVTDRDREIMAAVTEMNETTGADGGLTVPQDIQTTIKELRRTSDDLEQYVNIENVSTNKGSRVIEKDADSTPWGDVDEGEAFGEDNTPQFADVKYEIKKKGGILKVTYELLKDTAENVMNYLNKYIAKKSRATRNHAILTALDTEAAGTEIAVASLDELKDIFNVELDPAIAATSIVITNQYGFNWLDKLKDEKGNYILQPDPTDKTKRLLFGAYPVVPLSKKVLKNKETKIPLYIGDFVEALTLFDREKITIDINENVYWVNDKTGIKIRDRFDVKIVDGEAFVKAEVDTAPVEAAQEPVNDNGVDDPEAGK